MASKSPTGFPTVEPPLTPSFGVYFRKRGCTGERPVQIRLTASGIRSFNFCFQGSELGSYARSVCCPCNRVCAGICTCMCKLGEGDWTLRGLQQEKEIQGGRPGRWKESFQGMPRTFCFSFSGIIPLDHSSFRPSIHPLRDSRAQALCLGPGMMLHGPERQTLSIGACQ